MDSGYQHLERYTSANPELCEQIESTYPEIIRDSKFIDDKGRVWYKIIIMTSSLVLHPVSETHWAITSFKPIEDYQNIPETDITLVNNGNVFVLDTNRSLILDNFYDAYDKFNILQNANILRDSGL
jgi:uncharacterized protein YlzI (FlbEa/FlbD family)